jgi:NAD(P)H-hydrate repair Nnr-like enzyme with NAD(P)H-hydrate dehydratase domain
LLDRFGVKTTRTEVEGDLVGAAQQLANLTGAIVLLKAARTVVAAPGDISSRSDEAPHELATAGTGDVLAGLLGALLAKAGESADLFEIAKAGVWLHSEAARELAAGGNFAALDLANQLRSTILGLVNDGQ